jgi:hypothetical protein
MDADSAERSRGEESIAAPQGGRPSDMKGPCLRFVEILGHLASSGRAFAIGLAALFFLLNLLVVLNHAMWRDEWAVIQVGHHRSLIDMYNTISHSGHPVGWYVCAWALDHLGLNPWGLQVLHVLISTAYIYLFLRYTPFTNLEKFLFIFGYFPFFEYGGRVRDYAPEMLALVIACIVFTSRPRRPIAFGISLAFLAQTTSYGTIIGVALGIAYLFDLWWYKEPANASITLGHLVTGISIALLSMVVAYWQTRPLYNGYHAEMPGAVKSVGSQLVQGVGNIWSAYFPIPFESIWGSNILTLSPWLMFTLGILLFLTVVLFLLRSPTALIFFLVGTLELVGFNAVHTNVLRQFGHLFFVLLLSFWIDRRNNRLRSLDSRLPGIFLEMSKPREAFLVAILCTQAYAGITMALTEVYVPFSGSREAAEIIRKQFPPDAPIIGDTDLAVAPVSGYLDRPIFIPYRNEYCTYQKEEPNRRFKPTPIAELGAAINKVMKANRCDVVLLLNYQIDVQGDFVQQVGVVRDSMVPDEVYTIYRVRYDRDTRKKR